MSHRHLNRAFSLVGVTQLEKLRITPGFLSAVTLLLAELRCPRVAREMVQLSR